MAQGRARNGLLALHRAALTEILRRPLATILGVAIPLGGILLIAATDMLVGAGEEITRSSMSILLSVLLVTVTFGAVAAPVADARERGVLRLLAAFPVHRGALLLAHTPIALAAAVIVAAAGLTAGFTAARTPLSAIPGALAACAALAAVGIGLGSLCGSLSNRASQVRALGTLVPAVVLLTAGAVPFDAILPGADMAAGFVPTTTISRALAETLAGSSPSFAPTLWIALAGVALWGLGVARCRR